MRAIVGAISIVGAIVIACGEDRPLCYPGDFIGCTCDSGEYGYSSCGEFNGEVGYGACACDGTTPGLDAGSRDAPVEVAKLALFAPCTDAAQCASGMCFAYGDERLLCAKSCSGPDDCPPPSTGCNGKGVCEPP